MDGSAITALAAASPTCIISGNADGRNQIWDLLTRKCVATWRNSDPDNVLPILSILVNHRGTVIVRDRQSVKTWDPQGTFIAEFDIKESSDAILLPDARLVVLTGNYVCFCKVRNKPFTKPIELDHEAIAKAVAYTYSLSHESKDEIIKWVLRLAYDRSISIGCKPGLLSKAPKTANGSIIQWHYNRNQAQLQIQSQWSNHGLEIQQVGILENELVVASVVDESMFGDSYHLKILDVLKKKVVYTLNENVRCMAILPQDRCVIGTMQGEVKIYQIYRLNNPKLLKTFPQKIHAVHILHCVIARELKLYIMTAEATLQTWDGFGRALSSDIPEPKLETEVALQTRINLATKDRKADFTQSCFIVGKLFAVVDRLNSTEQMVRFWSLNPVEKTEVLPLLQSFSIYDKSICAVIGRNGVDYLLALNRDNQFELLSTDEYGIMGPFCISSPLSQHEVVFRLGAVSPVRGVHNSLTVLQLDFETLDNLAYHFNNFYYSITREELHEDKELLSSLTSTSVIRENLQAAGLNATSVVSDEKQDSRNFARHNYASELILGYLNIGGFFLPEPNLDAPATSTVTTAVTMTAAPQKK